MRFVLLLAIMFSPALSRAVLVQETNLQVSVSRITINEAKRAAIAYFRAEPKYQVKPGTRVGFERRNSKELTVESLRDQLRYFPPTSPNHQRIAALIIRFEQDPSLQIFQIWLSTGQGSERTQNVFQVEYRIVDGAYVSSVEEL